MFLGGLGEVETTCNQGDLINHHDLVVGDGVAGIDPHWDSGMSEKGGAGIAFSPLALIKNDPDPHASGMSSLQGCCNGRGGEGIGLHQHCFLSLVQGGHDGFKGWVRAAGGHGAYPHMGGDPITMAASVIQALNAIVSRKIDPMYPAVCSLGVIQGGAAFNVIPSEVMLAGTLRSFDPAVREQLFAEVEKAFALAKALGGDYAVELQRGYPPGINDATVAQWLDDAASDFLGSANVDRHTVGMAGEDFAYIQQQIPGAMIRVGAAVGDKSRPHHTPVFDIDERCMPIGVAILAETVRRYLRA